jgi:hypothetical protein
MKTSMQKCIRNVSAMASRHFELKYGGKAFDVLAKKSLEAIGWQHDYAASLNKNVAYIIEAPRNMKKARGQ